MNEAENILRIRLDHEAAEATKKTKVQYLYPHRKRQEDITHIQCIA